MRKLQVVSQEQSRAGIRLQNRYERLSRSEEDDEGNNQNSNNHGNATEKRTSKLPPTLFIQGVTDYKQMLEQIAGFI